MRKQLNVNYCVLNITCNYVDISKKVEIYFAQNSVRFIVALVQSLS